MRGSRINSLKIFSTLSIFFPLLGAPHTFFSQILLFHFSSHFLNTVTSLYPQLFSSSHFSSFPNCTLENKNHLLFVFGNQIRNKEKSNMISRRKKNMKKNSFPSIPISRNSLFHSKNLFFFSVSSHFQIIIIIIIFFFWKKLKNYFFFFPFLSVNQT